MPALYVLAGPNGSGKSTFATRILQPIVHLPFVNADVIAAERWPGAPSEHAYDASQAAATERTRLLEGQKSFMTETVFSHPSKLELVHQAVEAGYLVHLQVMLVPVEVAVARVAERVHDGGHEVPEQKIRQRFERLWELISVARQLADRTEFFDNSTARSPFRGIASYEHGVLIGRATWPNWTPRVLTN